MFRRWKWFRRRRRSSSAQRAAAAAALRDDRLVREALDDYVRLTFSQPEAASGAASPAGAASRTRCSVRRLPLDSAPRGHGRWNLDDQLLLGGRRRSYTVLYLRTSPTSSKTSQPEAGTSQPPTEPAAAGFSCDCSELSSCPHSSGQATTGDQPRRAVETADASTQAPIPRKPFRPWKQEKKKKEEPDTKDEPTTNDKAVQVDRSEFIFSKSSQTDSPRKHDEVDEDAEEPTAQVVRSQSATPRKRSKVEQSATPRKRSKEGEDSEEPTGQVVRSQPASPRKRSKEGEDTEEPTSQVIRSKSATPRKRSKEEQDTEEATPQAVRSQSATPRKSAEVQEDAEEPAASSARRSRALSRSDLAEAVTQTDEQPSQQMVVRLLPGPSGLPTIVIESTGSLQYASPNGQSTSNVGVQVRNEHLVAAAGEAARSARPGERRSKVAVGGRGRPSRTRVGGPRGGRSAERPEQRAPGTAEDAPQADDPGSLRWSEWDDKQSPWVATHKYSIRDTTEESNDSALRASTSSQYFDKRIAEESEPPAAAAGAPRVVLREAPASQEPAAAAPASCPLTGCPAERRGRPCGGTTTPTPPPTPPPTRPETPPGLHHPHVRRHDCVTHNSPSGGGQTPR